MKYYALYDENNKLTAIGIGNSGTEITKEEYNRLLNEIRTKADLVNRLYSGEITLSEVPAEWQEEIERRVNERIAAEGTVDEQELSAEEALDIILGGANV